MASKISRLGYFSGRPPSLAAGTKMVDQVPFFVAEIGRVWLAGFHAPMLSQIASLSQLFKHTLSSTLYNFIDAIDGLQQVSHVTAQGFYQVWGHKPMCKNDDLPSHGAARQPRHPLKIG